MALSVLEFVIASIAFCLCRYVLGYLFSNEAEVISYVKEMTPFLCASIIMDSLQAVLSGELCLQIWMENLFSGLFTPLKELIIKFDWCRSSKRYRVAAPRRLCQPWIILSCWNSCFSVTRTCFELQRGGSMVRFGYWSNTPIYVVDVYNVSNWLGETGNIIHSAECLHGLDLASMQGRIWHCSCRICYHQLECCIFLIMFW